ncbi:hypothetical protein [Pedobacter frigiditerrae]|uniref:hypothetical protein n=1 Tax=Pedobacter frigiditerrae TaxID=2530452 RepID=UPI0029312E92|nr:hypothetical protein [Pedobacter frigiditerrae]
MKSLNWKKSLIFCVSFFAVFFGELAVNIACGPEQDPYDYYVSYFHNNVQGDQYKPFAFNGLLFLNSEDDVWAEENVNSAEWAKYLGVKLKDVRKIMYELDSASDVRLKKASFKWTSTLPDSLKKNNFLAALSKNKAALNYYRLLKQCEPMISHIYGSWTQPIVDSVFLMKCADKNLALLPNFKDDFLKLRYAYQIQRMYRYAGNKQQSKMVYEKYIANNPSTSAVKGWAISQYAGIIRAEGKADEAAFLFSKVFASNPERRIVAYRNYFWTSAKMDDVLKFAKSEDEKANIYAINGFKKPDSEIQLVKDVYECNPANQLVGALVIREVNKLEQNLLERSPMAYDYFSASIYGNYFNYGKNADSLKTANLKHLKVVRDFATRIANEKKYIEPDFGNITAAYLSWIEHNDVLAMKYLNKVNLEKLSPKLKDQYRITELLVKANQIKKGNNFNENELLPALKWLDEKRLEENPVQPKDSEYYYGWNEGEKSRYTITTRNFYQQVLAPAYTKLGDTAKAALAMLKGDAKYKLLKNMKFKKSLSYQTTMYWMQSLSENTLDKIATYKTKTAIDNFDGLLAKSLNQFSSDDFYELQGTAHLRAHQYAKAIECFNKLSKTYKYWMPEEWEWLDNGKHLVHKQYANAFAETVTDYPKKYVNKPNRLNKKTFAKKMLNLQRLANTDKKNAAQYYYQMAKGLYQTGEFGNAWFFISYDWRIFANQNRGKYDYNSDYKLALKAKEYFEKARELSKDANFKAKCTFMLARCEQKKILQKYDAITWNETEDYEKLGKEQDRIYTRMNSENPYFAEMKNQYAKTPFYKTAVNECSYLKDFLKRSQ